MKTLIKTLLFLIMLSIMSCSTMHTINKNGNLTKKIFFSELKKNGNAFHIGTAYVATSTVWTYTDNKIVIYQLAKGKIHKRTEFPNNGISNYYIPSEFVLDSDVIDNCPPILSGGFFGFKIKKESEIKFGIGIDIKCLTSNKYQSEFLNKIVADISMYKMR